MDGRSPVMEENNQPISIKEKETTTTKRQRIITAHAGQHAAGFSSPAAKAVAPLADDLVGAKGTHGMLYGVGVRVGVRETPGVMVDESTPMAARCL